MPPVPEPYVHARPRVPGVVTAVGYRQVSPDATLHRAIPSPYLTLVLSLAGPVTGAAQPEGLDGPTAFRYDVLLGALDTRPAYLLQPQYQAGIQLSVHPLAARSLLGAPASELAGLAMDGTDVLGPEAERVRQRIAEQETWAGAFDHLTTYLRSRAGRPVPDAPRAELVAAWTWLARFRGRGSMDGLARHVAMSPRQLRTLFHREVGLGPKAVSGLFRFHHATRCMTSSTAAPVTLAEVAQRCGYADQAHLARDFRRYTGTSPSRWLAEERGNIRAGGYADPEA